MQQKLLSELDRCPNCRLQIIWFARRFNKNWHATYTASYEPGFRSQAVWECPKCHQRFNVYVPVVWRRYLIIFLCLFAVHICSVLLGAYATWRNAMWSEEVIRISFYSVFLFVVWSIWQVLNTPRFVPIKSEWIALVDQAKEPS